MVPPTSAPPGAPEAYRAVPAPAPPLPPHPRPPEPETAPRRHPWLRLLAGCLCVLLCSAGIGAVFVLDQVHRLRDALAQNAPLALPASTLAPVGWGQTQTLLLVGDDQRSLTGAFRYYSKAVLPHSNEMLLVRIDPSKPFISMMSIPRELMVTIYPPGRYPVTTRFNYAYTAGGIPLLVATIKQVLGISVNHVMVVTFGRFQRAVNEMGCVYSTVDQRYYHVNVPGGAQYQEINLQPGYQDMCGTQALEFVSYRHTDDSLIRDARDQSFLLDVKQQYGPTLVDNISKFEHIFGQAVQTDPGLQSTTGLLNLIGTLISSSGRRVRQVQFQADLSPTDPQAVACQCVTASQEQISASVHDFIYGSSPIPKHSVAAAAHAVHRAGAVARLPLVQVSPGQVGQARTAAQRISFPYEYPAVQDRGGSGIPVYFRDYSITAPGGSSYPIYVDVFSAGLLGEFYDVQGTTWTTAPILDGAQQTVSVAGRTYYLHYEGSQLQTVAWEEHGAAYWVRNSLTESVPNGELLAIAEQTKPLPGTDTAPAKGGARGGGRVRLQSALIPTRIVPPPKTPMLETVGRVGGLATLAATPLLLILMLRRGRHLRAARRGLDSTLALGSQVGPALPALPPGARNGHAVWRLPGSAERETLWSKHPVTLRAVSAAAVVAVAAAVAVPLVQAHRHAAKPAAVRRLRPAGPPVPTGPVVVLNSTATAGAAHTLAVQLQRRGVDVTGVGNLNEARPSGLWILYAPGHAQAASELARLLPHRGATVAPIDPVAQAAAGIQTPLVVVIA